MTYPVELTAEEMQRVREAEAKGFDVAALAKAAVAGVLETLPAPTKQEEIGGTPGMGDNGPPVSAFARRRLAEIARATPEELEEGEREVMEFMRNMNEERRRAGSRILYPDVAP